MPGQRRKKRGPLTARVDSPTARTHCSRGTATRSRFDGLLTAVDGRWLTLNLGGREPFLRIPRRAIVQIVPWAGPLAPDSAPLSIGQDIRVVSPELAPRMLIGNLRAIDDETLLVKVAGRDEPIRVQRSTIERLDVAREHSRAGSGAVAGAIVLGIPGALFGCVAAAGSSLGCEGS